MDRQYRFSKYTPSLRSHDYGKNVKLLDDPYLLNLVTNLSNKETKQPMINVLLKEAYKYMLGPVLNSELSLKDTAVKTRMYKYTRKAVFEAKSFSPNSKFVVSNLIRAGIIPSLMVYEQLFLLFKPENVRLDNIFISRKVSKKGKITGADISGLKTGEGIEGMNILIPDPMGATGSSVIKVINMYKAMKEEPKKIIIMGLMITPEYLKNVRRRFPEVKIYTVRLDRGLSQESILNSIPGKNWNKEKGLNPSGYIVPGAGGLGELINNTTF